MIFTLLRFGLTIGTAYFMGKLVARIKLPAILGWLLTGMILGPHALSLVSQEMLDAAWYETLVHVLECSVGLMIGTELVWNKIKRSGKAIIITTLTQSLGTFAVVSLVFGVVFWFTDVPVYLALVFGGIALATAPAPALSIVREFKTSGPVTQTLIPMAALDDIVGCVVFFIVMALVAGNLSAGSLPASMIALVIVLPILIGVAVGLVAGVVLKKERDKPQTLALLIGMILVAAAGGFVFNAMLPRPVLNFMLIGMSFSATFSNMISETRLEQIMGSFSPLLGGAMIVTILNLGAPLDYHLILGAGLFTAIYILARAAGKYGGAYLGAAITKSPETVKKYLGLTLLPHSGVSLVFTGIAVSVLTKPAPECARIVQGTIAAAAVINELIAVLAAKKGFEWAGEMNGSGGKAPGEQQEQLVVTISRQYGSGGREIGKKVAQQLGLPFYDREIIERAAQNSSMDIRLFENSETKDVPSLLSDLTAGVQFAQPVMDKVFLQQAGIIEELAAKGSCVMVGRCADAILYGHHQTLRVYIYADADSRRKRVEGTYHEPGGDLEKREKNRCTYYKHYTGKRFGDAENYDLCLNSGTLGEEECVKAICSAFHNHKAL